MRTRLLVGAVFLAVFLPTGCSETTSGSMPCSDSEYANPRAALEASDWVGQAIVNELRKGDATPGGAARVYEVRTTGLRGFKADDVGFDALPVLSTPHCGDVPYPDGDPLEGKEGERVILFLLRGDNGPWRTLSYKHGVLPSVDDALPAAWPQ